MDNGTILKNEKEILLPTELKFLEYEHTYHLSGIFSHSGSAEGGHYWLEVYSNNHWLKCNDSVIEISQFDTEIPTRTATCLVYAIEGVFKSYKINN